MPEPADRTPTGDKTAQCGASSRIGLHYLVPYFGPCVLRADHDGPVHEDANGTQWTDPRPAKAGDLAALCPPAGGLRERLAEALYQHTLATARPTPFPPDLPEDPWLARARQADAARADAVLPVVRSALAAAERRAEEAERERDDYRQRFANQMTAATELTTTLREAERKLQQALEAIADERRGRLAAEAAVRRARGRGRRVLDRGGPVTTPTPDRTPTGDLREHLRAAIDDAGRHQVTIAADLGVTTKHLCAMLTGRARLTLEWAERIAEACGRQVVVAVVEPDSGLRERLREALTREHYRRARERIEASPEEHCAAFADAVLPIVQAERRRTLADLDAGRGTTPSGAARMSAPSGDLPEEIPGEDAP